MAKVKRRRGLGDQPKEIGLREGNIFKMSSAKQRKQAKEKKLYTRQRIKIFNQNISA